MMNPRKSILFTILLLGQLTSLLAADDWKETLKQELPLLGHGNWIVVADAANSGAFPEAAATARRFRHWIAARSASPQEVRGWLEALQPDGSWKDIDYADPTHQLQTATLTLNGKCRTAAFPRKPFAGQTVRLTF